MINTKVVKKFLSFINHMQGQAWNDFYINIMHGVLWGDMNRLYTLYNGDSIEKHKHLMLFILESTADWLDDIISHDSYHAASGFKVRLGWHTINPLIAAWGMPLPCIEHSVCQFNMLGWVQQLKWDSILNYSRHT